MKWPVLFIGIVLVAGVIIFAVSYGSPATNSVATSTTEIVPTAGSGVEGVVLVRCLTDATDVDCMPQVRTIHAYQGVSAVGLFKTTADGSFRNELPPGQYELRVDAASTTDCGSVGVVVAQDAYISTEITCEVGA